MSTSPQMPVVLTVRGTLVPQSLEAARVVHNETAGSAAGIAAARALGDLSHKVYAPSSRSTQSGAKPGELLFIDNWVDAQGIMSFFANHQVQQMAGALFSARDAAVWMPAQGSYSWALPAPMGKDERCVGMVRGAINSPEEAISIFRAVDENAVRDARRRGMIAHHVYIRMNPPGDAQPHELLGLDLWCDFAGMTEHYEDRTHMVGLGAAFAGRPAATVWEQAEGQWSEW